MRNDYRLPVDWNRDSRESIKRTPTSGQPETVQGRCRAVGCGGLSTTVTRREWQSSQLGRWQSCQVAADYGPVNPSCRWDVKCMDTVRVSSA